MLFGYVGTLRDAGARRLWKDVELFIAKFGGNFIFKILKLVRNLNASYVVWLRRAASRASCGYA